MLSLAIGAASLGISWHNSKTQDEDRMQLKCDYGVTSHLFQTWPRYYPLPDSLRRGFAPVMVIGCDLSNPGRRAVSVTDFSAATGATHRELLVRYGMPETFLDDLGTALDSFEQAINEKHAGRAAHVGARADLAAVGAEIMLIVGQLDALNRFRFRTDAESLAAWKSARDVAWPMPPEKGDAQKPAA